jgi:hypothetical protein
MQIHQLQVAFDAAQDRLLLRVSTTGGAEIRAHLTRRYVRLLWPEFMRVIDASAALATPAPEARREVLAFEREKALAQTDFSKPFGDAAAGAAPRRFPLGEAPFLATRAQVRVEGPGRYRLTIDPAAGRGIEIALDARLMHSLLRLIESAVRAAEWNLDLAAPPPGAAATAAVPAARLLN